ncbi:MULTISPECIES: GhoT/OrtT family toxin [Enterobacter]|jgi:uncharacterized membrane protein|uniref:DUF2566 domain-containing protein n=2 Tax=Enterobacter kobei TaxID=208224 RepID=A0AA86IQK3_9ENTR|nr:MULTISPECIES: GhoT/OrtT family toxin [Enterobacter]MBV7407149.1 GhoT/OrtT family toxin [Enterobacter sp. ENT03]OLR21051.1 DUF2566 domain-containing protein [Enterobacter kobei]BCU55610.1 DUF2566 domain-containing protein [Enterobacter kobei]SIQ79468.1 Protein of unknown function [Enterobacter kobei]
MTLYFKLLIFYAVMAVVCGVITWFLTKDKGWVRLLAAVLVGLTWPMSFPMALLLSLF